MNGGGSLTLLMCYLSLINHIVMKTVLITGIGKGIGKALAQKFLHEGYVVLGTATTTPVDVEHEHLSVFALDLTSLESIQTCVEQIAGTGKRVDVLINNAGILADEEETRVKTELLRETLEVNLIGTIDFCERIIPLMVDGGHILNISSTAGSLEFTGKVSHYSGHYPCYKISKAALNMYTRTLAGELKEKGIAVSSVHPGWVRTDRGGAEADMSPEQAAHDIYALVVSNPRTGGFWFKGESLPW